MILIDKSGVQSLLAGILPDQESISVHAIG